MENKIEIIGCYSPNFMLKPVSMYKVYLNKKIVYLDMGYGNANKVDLNTLDKAIIIISHNHIDHAAGLVELAIILRLKNVELKEKINVYIPNRVAFFKLSTLYQTISKYFNFVYINEHTAIDIEEYKITFCKTVHKGESYAIKFMQNETLDSFVYTSDIAVVTKELINFCYKTNVILMEGGRPEDSFSLKDYHATTSHLIENITNAKPRKILITHLKVSAEKNSAYSIYCKEKKVSVVALSKVYNIF